MSELDKLIDGQCLAKAPGETDVEFLMRAKEKVLRQLALRKATDDELAEEISRRHIERATLITRHGR